MTRRFFAAWAVPVLALALSGVTLVGAAPEKCPITGKPLAQCCGKKSNPNPPCCQFSCSKEGHAKITALAAHGYSRKCPTTGQPASMCCSKSGGGAPCCQSGACGKKSTEAGAHKSHSH